MDDASQVQVTDSPFVNGNHSITGHLKFMAYYALRTYITADFDLVNGTILTCCRIWLFKIDLLVK